MRLDLLTTEREKIEDRLTRSFSVGAGGLLSVESEMGSVQVESWESDEIRVEVMREVEAEGYAEAEDKFKQLRFDFAQNGNDVRLRAEFFGGARGLEVTYRISLPRVFNLKLNTAAGHVSVNKLQGTIEAKSAGGNVRLHGIQGALALETTGGHIELEDCTGDVSAHTSGGNIEIRLTPDAGVTVEAKAVGGRVETNLPLHVQGVISRNSLKADIGGGGSRMSLRTNGGNIYLRQ